MQITYSTIGINGQPRLQYRGHVLGQQRDLSFSRDQIDSLESDIGRLITVYLVTIPDLGEIALTLLLPTSINLEGPEGAIESSIGGPQWIEYALQDAASVS